MIFSLYSVSYIFQNLIRGDNYRRTHHVKDPHAMTGHVDLLSQLCILEILCEQIIVDSL